MKGPSLLFEQPLQEPVNPAHDAPAGDMPSLLADHSLDADSLEAALLRLPDGKPYRRPVDPFDIDRGKVDYDILNLTEPKREWERFLLTQADSVLERARGRMTEQTRLHAGDLLSHLRDVEAGYTKEIQRQERKRADLVAQFDLCQISLAEFQSAVMSFWPTTGNVEAASTETGVLESFIGFLRGGRNLKTAGDLIQAGFDETRRNDEWRGLLIDAITVWRQREELAWRIDRVKAVQGMLRKLREDIARALGRIDALAAAAEQSLDALQRDRAEWRRRAALKATHLMPDVAPDVAELSKAITAGQPVRVPVDWLFYPPSTEGEVLDAARRHGAEIARKALAGADVVTLLAQEYARRGRPVADDEGVRWHLFDSVANDERSGVRPHTFATTSDDAIARRTMIQITADGRVLQELAPDSGIAVRSAALPWRELPTVAILELWDQIDPRELTAVKECLDAVDAANAAGNINALLPELIHGSHPRQPEIAAVAQPAETLDALTQLDEAIALNGAPRPAAAA